MAEHDHSHEHHDHEHGHDEQAVHGVGYTDTASQSLADALRVSFRLLRFILYVVIVLFLATGIRSIQEQEVGILKVFGKVTGTAKAGLTYNWPFPIGQIETVDISERTVDVDHFWLAVKPEDQGKSLDLLQPPGFNDGVRPGVDGALLTGDRSVLHVKLSVRYAVRDPIAYARSIDNLGDQVQTAVALAAIQAAAGRTADAIYGSESAQFVAQTRQLAQEQLNALTAAPGEPGGAVEIVAVVLDQRSWPLRARAAYEQAQQARQQAQQMVNQAIADARSTLNDAAGDNYPLLVGYPWIEQAQNAGVTTAESQPATAAQQDLIGQYDAARRGGDPAEADRLLAAIDDILVSGSTGGRAAQILEQARVQRTTTPLAVAARAKRFNELLGAWKKDPKFVMERLWIDAREAILNGPLVEKYYVTPGQGQTVLRIARDPQVVKELREAQIQEQSAPRAGESAPRTTLVPGGYEEETRNARH